MAWQVGRTYMGVNFYGAYDEAYALVGQLGTRTFQKAVTFPTEFSAVPGVLVYLSGIYHSSGNLFINLTAESVATTGFLLQVKANGECQVPGISVTWMAFESSEIL